PGAAPWRPDITGINLPGVYTLRDLKDADVLHAAVARGVRSAVVVGAGFIGVEVAENLVHRGVQVTVIELANQILPPWDAEMVSPLQEQMASRGVHFVLGASATQIVTDGEQLTVTLSDGGTRETDMVILAVGVRPENSLAKSAGIDCGPRGGIVTNEHMQTNDPDIYAVGDAVEVTDFNTGQKTQIPLAGPANRQGRIAADHICGRPSTYRGTQGTAIVGAFGMAAAMTGLSEKQLRRMEIPHERIYIHPSHHAGYYPGARPMTLKLLFSPSDGRILGAQAVGWDGVDKRIDVLAIALQAGMTVYDLEEVELCYAPQFGSAKDPINMAGFVAAGVLREDHPVAHATDLVSERPEDVFVLDVRTQGEWDAARVTGATHIPLEQLRSRLHEVPTDSKTIAYCKVGQRGYLATRILLQSGRAAANLSGGITSWQMANGETVGGD
ncbi:MAG: FAD-dependent oxidoreductase, partial [Planctomycetales bacterium]|nr:FAD-dependent oxidoreductase [Planctomycetales bacterium]